MSASRLRPQPIPVLTKATNKLRDHNPSTSPTTSTAPKKSFVYMQSLGLLSLLVVFVIIGFQMTTSDVYDEIRKTHLSLFNLSQTSTPSPIHSSAIELVVHEDDGDVEIDVPSALPLDINASFTSLSNIRRNQPRGVPPKFHDLIFRAQRRNFALRNRSRHPYHNKTRGKKPPHYGQPMINIKANPGRHVVTPPLLPTIDEMSKDPSRRFYSDLTSPATVYGATEQCHACPKRKFAIVSGLYNTGTNVAFRLIAPNCRTLTKFQPGWGKHEMFDDAKIEHFNTHTYPASPIGTYDDAVLVVVVKDPLTWMKSMCKANYDFRYFNRTWFFETCPTYIHGSKFDWLPMNRGKVMNRGANKTSNGIFKSPIHLWNEWVSSVVYHVNGYRWPHLIVRFEDMLFRPQSVVPQFCKCLGSCGFRRNVNKKHIKIPGDVSKPHGNARNRTLSFWAYSNPQYRYEGYTKEDLQYMLDAIDPRLLHKFGYEFDVEKTKRMRM